MVPPDASIPLKLVGILVVELQTEHLGGVAAIGVTAHSTTTATAATVESLVVDVVGTSHEHDAVLVLEEGAHATLGITLLRTDAEVDIPEEAPVHACLEAEVEHGLLIAVVDAGDAGQVAPLVVGLDAVDDRGGQVLQGSLGVTSHELLAVDLDFLHLLTIDGDFSIVIYLCAREFPHQFLDHRTFRHAVGSRVVDECVFPHHHLGSLSGGCHPFQQDGVGTEREVAHVDVLATNHRDVLGERGVSHAGHLHDVPAGLIDRDLEIAVVVRQTAGDKGAVGFQQLQSGLEHTFIVFLVYKFSCDVLLLGICGSREQQHRT